jgi:hypothetical protein
LSLREACGAGPARKGLWVYIGPDTKTEVHAALGDAIPGFGLGQVVGLTLMTTGEDFRTAQGNRRGPR